MFVIKNNLHLLLLSFVFFSFYSPLVSANKTASQAAGLAASIGTSIGLTNTKIGKKLMKPCKSGDPETKAVTCPLMAMAYGQAASLLVAAAFNKKSESGFRGGVGSDNWDSGDWESIAKLADPDLTQSITEGLSALKDQGYDVDVKTGDITTPNGKKVPGGSLASGAAMANAGLIDADQINEADELLKNIKNDFKKAKLKLINGSSGGGSPGGSRKTPRYVYETEDESSGFGFGSPIQANRTGLQRTLASGEVIGARTENIFNMVNRRYQDKVAEKIFVESK